MKVKGWKKIYLANVNPRKAGMAMVEFRAKKFTRNKQVHFIMIKVSIYQEDTAI